MVSKTIGRGFKSFHPCQMGDPMQLVNYFRDVVREARNIKFPTRQDVRITSVVIVVMIAIFMMFVSTSDFVISRLIRLFFGIL